MVSHYRGPKGKVEKIEIQSQALEGNMLGDPTLRDVYVYIPHGYEEGAERHYPLMMYLAGYTNSGAGQINWKPFAENLPERLDRLIGTCQMDPVVMVMPDCFTRLGGNQYINSVAMGNYHDFLVDEVVPAVETLYKAGGEGKRACLGKSSGGYGAMMQGLLNQGLWTAIACQSGDMGFEQSFLPELPKILTMFSAYGYSTEKFMQHVESQPFVKGADTYLMLALGLSASYSPNPEKFLGIELPCDPYTSELIPDLWDKWLKHDPVHLAERHQDNLRQLKGLFIDCGNQDDYHLHYGARIMSRKLKQLNVPHTYEEFDGTHSNIDHRLDQSLPYLEKIIRG